MSLKCILLFSIVITFLSEVKASSLEIPDNALIRDAEIEAYINEWLVEIFKAGKVQNLKPHLYLLSNKSINAAASTGGRILINLGLITQSDNVEEVLFVLAHETGHIKGGHIASIDINAHNSVIFGLTTALLGAAGALAAKDFDVFAASAYLGSQLSDRTFKKTMRDHEYRADQEAVGVLKTLGITLKGATSLFKKMQLKTFNRPSTDYESTHPLTSDRIKLLDEYVIKEGHIKPSLFFNKAQEQYALMRGKINGYMMESKKVFEYYEGKKSPEANYARIIAHWKSFDTTTALKLLDDFIKHYPQNIYLLMLKAEILFKEGKITESIIPLQYVLSKSSNNPLINFLMGHILLENKTPEKAIPYLEKSVTLDSDSFMAWHQLARAYGEAKRQPYADWALGEIALRQKNIAGTLIRVERALKAPSLSPNLKQKLMDLKNSVIVLQREKINHS